MGFKVPLRRGIQGLCFLGYSRFRVHSSRSQFPRNTRKDAKISLVPLKTEIRVFSWATDWGSCCKPDNYIDGKYKYFCEWKYTALDKSLLMSDPPGDKCPAQTTLTPFAKGISMPLFVRLGAHDEV